MTALHERNATMKSRKRPFARSAWLVVTGMILAGCADTSANTSAGEQGSQGAATAERANPADDSMTPVKIGWVNSEIGTPAFPELTAGARAAVKYINGELGGWDGHPVELVECAVGADEASNQKCGQQLANDEDVLVVASGLLFNGGPLYSALDSKNKAVVGRVPLTGADVNASNALQFGSGSFGSAAGTAASFAEDDRVQSVGVMALGNDAGLSTIEAFERVLKDTGKSVTSVQVDPASPDIAGSLSSLADVDAVWFGVPDSMCTQIVTSGLTQPDQKLTGSSSCVNSLVWSQSPDKQEGWEFTTSEVPLDAGSGVNDELDTFLEQFPAYSDAEAERFTPVGWATILTVLRTLEGADVETLTPATAQETIRGYEGPIPMGVQNAQCTGEPYTAICINDVMLYRVEGETAVQVGEVPIR